MEVRQFSAPEEEDLFDYFYHKPGTEPGTIAVDRDAPPSEVDLIDYTSDRAVRVTNLSLEECRDYLQTDSVSWIDISGLGSASTLQQLGELLNLHPVALEEIVHVPQRPKIVDYRDRLTVVTQMPLLKENGEGFYLEQVSIVLGENYVLTVQEEPDRDAFDPVRDRIRTNRSSIRDRGNDYLAYALWDAIVDGFFPILEAYGERIEELEDEVVLDPDEQTLSKIYQIRRELLALRRAMWPQREAINTLLRDGSPLIGQDVLVYLRDCYNHAVQIIDIIETYRELTSGLMDVYLSAMGNRMNEVMKLLTVISTIFIPLTFIAGIYGMNFNTEVSPWNMPELNWYWGYPACLGAMAVMTVVMVYLFWRRGWFENAPMLKADDRPKSRDRSR